MKVQPVESQVKPKEKANRDFSKADALIFSRVLRDSTSHCVCLSVCRSVGLSVCRSVGRSVTLKLFFDLTQKCLMALH